MAGKANGLTSRHEHFPLHHASLSAIQELIGTIGASDTCVARFILGEYEVFLFAARQRKTQHGETARTGVGMKARRTRDQRLSAASNTAAEPLDSIVAKALRTVSATKAKIQLSARPKALTSAMQATACATPAWKRKPMM